MPNGPALSETKLRRRVGTRIGDGRLPVIYPAMLRPGHGSDKVCRVCEQRIDRYRLEYQVTDGRDERDLSFHLMCLGHWQRECRRLLAEPDRGICRWSGSAKSITRRLSSHPR